MDEKEIQENLRLIHKTLRFMTFREKFELVETIQKSVPNWNQAIVDEYKKLKKELTKK